uniref:Uncharacterized protein n=1 Tax=Arundo donax TaxID=35708 RepID=A0A0A9GEQ2_ARUDO
MDEELKIISDTDTVTVTRVGTFSMTRSLYTHASSLATKTNSMHWVAILGRRSNDVPCVPMPSGFRFQAQSRGNFYWIPFWCAAEHLAFACSEIHSWASLSHP